MSDFGDQLGAQLVDGDHTAPLAGVHTTAAAQPVVGDCPEGCGWVLPAHTNNPNRDIAAHRRGKHGIQGSSSWSASAKQRRGRKVPRDTPPAGPAGTTIKVDLRPPKGAAKGADPALERVEARARNLAEVVSMVLVLAQQIDDAADVERGKDAVAHALRQVAEHEKWLRDMFAAGGTTSDRAMAWMQLVFALVGMLAPILMRHGIVAAPVARLLAMAPPAAPAAPADDAAPVAA